MTRPGTSGFTLIELLIVLAIIGILAAVLLPNLLRSRANAVDKAARLYASEVYKTASAHISDSPTATLVVGDCTSGYTAGTYNVRDPGGAIVSQCTVSADADNTPRVLVQAAAGTTISLP